MWGIVASEVSISRLLGWSGAAGRAFSRRVRCCKSIDLYCYFALVGSIKVVSRRAWCCDSYMFCNVSRAAETAGRARTSVSYRLGLRISGPFWQKAKQQPQGTQKQSGGQRRHVNSGDVTRLVGEFLSKHSKETSRFCRTKSRHQKALRPHLVPADAPRLTDTASQQAATTRSQASSRASEQQSSQPAQPSQTASQPASSQPASQQPAKPPSQPPSQPVTS